MESASAKTSPMVRSPFSSPNAGALLKERIRAWSEETGLRTYVCVRIDDKSFELHKSPLISKCGYFKKVLLETSDVELPPNFPGGSETFEMVALFSYDSPLPLDPFNVSALRCAADFLEMTEEYASGNLHERSDLYLNQVVLQSWDDTLIVLQKCRTLLPWSEELLIVSRCIESLAFMACMEILDPEQRRDPPVVNLQALTGRSWNCEAVKEIAGRDLWVKDLIALPFEFFKRIIGSLRRQGMKEKYVSPLVVFYANKWVLSKKTHKFWENTTEHNGADSVNKKVSAIFQGILELLPMGEKATRVVPGAFYFALLSRSLSLSLGNDSRAKLEHQVASLLHFAQIEDFPLPESSKESIASTAELKMMERILSIHFSSKNETGYSGCTPLNGSSVVAELWDRYLSQIAIDPKLGLCRFMELIEVVPMTDRETHDHLYQAMSIFLMKHPHLSTEEKAAVCRYLNCQKLSQETCIQAVQNDLMPLRLIVQALFVQQLHTHQAFRDCSDSFRYMQCGEFSGSLPSSRCQLPKSQNLAESPYQQGTSKGETVGTPLGSLLHKDLSVEQAEITKAEYESTSFRIQALEQELMSLKQSLQCKNMLKGSAHKVPKKPSFRLSGLERKTVVKRRNPLGQVSSCIGSMSWTSQRKYANRLLKIFRRIALLGRGQSKIKQAASGLSNGSLACRSKSLHEMYDC
ncbi:BTB/POZ domain-containing protein [Cocos nucifera]|uniref:BTB/POZ domain-containing protein n=1 Tax=Cocos nucifera TaxID=13894 RepID=A0A8K0I8Y0_COCNU|nr:BTB/POZ domain-containing protein [Cocos nucifera]